MTYLKFHLCSLAVLCALACSAPASADTLYGAVHAAIKVHPSVGSARAALDAAEETRVEQASGYFPSISASVSGGRMFGDNSTTRGFNTTRGVGYSYLWEGNVTARQMIFDGFETQSRVGSAKAQLKSADFSLVGVRESLALRTVQVYVEAMRAYEGLAMLKGHEGRVLGYLERIKLSVDEGTADHTQYHQALDIKVILDGFVADYGARVRNAEAQYLELTGALPEGNMSVPAPDLTIVPKDAEAALRYAEKNHPSLVSALYTARSAELDVSSEKAQLYPNVNGELSYLKSDKEDVLGGEAEDKRALVRMNWSFDTGGAQLARVQKKKYDYQASQSRLDELRQQIATGVRFAYTELDVATAQLRNKKKREALNAKLFETYEVQFEGARVNLMQLMQADNQAFNTRLEKMLGEYRVLAAQYGILASMGRLQEGVSAQDSQVATLGAHDQK